MASKNDTSDQEWLLGQIEAPIRADTIRELLERRLRTLLDWGFSVSATSGAATVSLGALTLLTAFCESEPCNSDAVVNFVANRTAPGQFASQYIEVEDKIQTTNVALEQLEIVLATLRTFREELESSDVPMAWASDDRFT